MASFLYALTERSKQSLGSKSSPHCKSARTKCKGVGSNAMDQYGFQKLMRLRCFVHTEIGLVGQPREEGPPRVRQLGKVGRT